MFKVTFRIDGEPKGKGRPRFTKSGFAFTPADTERYESLVRDAYRSSTDHIFHDSLKASIKACYGLVKGDYGKNGLNKSGNAKLGGSVRPTKKPDCDNIAKIVLDSLNAVAYRDDSQVVELSITKQYAELPYVEVTLEEI